jgi:hypothetical protein
VGDPQTPAIGVNVSSSSSNLLPPGHLLAERSSSQLRGERPAINAVLARLRRRIRGYVLLEGVALLCIVCGVLFWLTLALDWAYFRITALELPRWFREAVAVAAIVLVVAGLMFWIVLRYFARFRARALALVLERRFPELGTRLITAVEMAEAHTGRETPLTAAMVERTIDEAAQMSSALRLESVFDRTPLRRALVSAVVLVASVGTFSVVDAAAVSRWVHAFVNQDAVYWSRETQLVVKAIVQPGDRVREFRNGQLKHPRGVDLVLLVEVPEGAKAPAAVELDYTLDGGRGSGSLEMVKSGDRKFRHSISALLDSLSLWVSGGDYISRIPMRVEVVDAPRLDQVTLDCDYPNYTGLNRDSQGNVTRHTVEVQSSQVSLPMETGFVLHARANKPLVAMRIESESRRINITRDRATIAVRSPSGDAGPEQPLPPPPSGSFLSPSGTEAEIPFLLAAKADPKKADVLSHAGSAAKAALRREDSLSRLPIAIPADCRMRIELEDTDGITSVEPIRLVINGVVDQPPVVQTELRGISASITRKATIPVTGTVTDDYGLAKAEFQFRVDKEKDWRISPFRHPPAGTPKEFALRREESDNTERFEVLPLELKVGQRLILSVFAQDGDNLNGPHSTRSEEYVFQIVSDEELLSLLYVKEVNLRERFEKIISELEGVKKDLVDHQGRARATDARSGGTGSGTKTAAKTNPRDAEGDPESLGDLQTAIAVCAVRSLHQVRKNSVETASVEESFRGLLDELVNNAVHTQQMADRIGQQIVQPLHLANEKDFPAADEAIGLFKLATDSRRDPVPQIENSVRTVTAVIGRLKMALAEMQDLVKFHELTARLQGMIKDQEQIIDTTKQEQKKKRLKELEDLK